MMEAVNDDPVIVTPAERHFVDYLADMYSAIMCLEKLERAHNRDLLPNEEYKNTLERTLSRIKTIEAQLSVAVASGLRYSGLDDFLQTYGVAHMCGAAQARLIAAAKQEEEKKQQEKRDKENAEKQQQQQNSNANENAINPTNVLQAAQHFITLMDCLKLNQRSTDQLYPLIAELINAVKRVHPTFEQLPRLTGWYTLLDSMKASEELDDEQVREFLFDVERGYSAFYKALDEMQKK